MRPRLGQIRDFFTLFKERPWAKNRLQHTSIRVHNILITKLLGLFIALSVTANGVYLTTHLTMRSL